MKLFIVPLVFFALLVAVPADADRWRQKRITVIDHTHGWPVAGAVGRWGSVTVINPISEIGSDTMPPDAPLCDGCIAVYKGNFNTQYSIASTQLVRGRRGFIVAARIVINTYWNYPFDTDTIMYVLVHELGHAFASLPHNDRPTSVMNGYATFPDAGDIAAMNDAYRH